MQTFQGFLLTRNWRDRPAGIELEYWFATEYGPVCVIVDGAHSVFFLARAAVQDARGLIQQFPDAKIKDVDLRDFQMCPVVAVYFSSHRQARRCADALRERGLEPLEADINPAERFLMERFITGSALLRGELVQRGNHHVLSNPSLKRAHYRPALKVVSFDIETAMSGLQLFSIGVHGVFEQIDSRLSSRKLGSMVAG